MPLGPRLQFGAPQYFELTAATAVAVGPRGEYIVATGEGKLVVVVRTWLQLERRLELQLGEVITCLQPIEGTSRLLYGTVSGKVGELMLVDNFSELAGRLEKLGLGPVGSVIDYDVVVREAENDDILQACLDEWNEAAEPSRVLEDSSAK